MYSIEIQANKTPGTHQSPNQKMIDKNKDK